MNKVTEIQLKQAINIAKQKLLLPEISHTVLHAKYKGKEISANLNVAPKKKGMLWPGDTIIADIIITKKFFPDIEMYAMIAIEINHVHSIIRAPEQKSLF